MQLPTDRSPDIKLTFAGIMVASIREDRPLCHFGIVKKAPDHVVKVEIAKAHGDSGVREVLATFGDYDLAPRFSLSVSEPLHPGIQLFKGDVEFDRLQDKGDSLDYRWVLDFDSEVYPEGLTVNEGGFRSIFELDNGLFLTRRISDDQLRKKRLDPTTGKAENEPTIIGRVATAIGAHIFLGDGGSAVFTNGEKAIELKPESGIVFEIEITQNRKNRTAPPTFNHATLYEAVIANRVRSSGKVRLEPLQDHTHDAHHPHGPGEEEEAGDPHAECLTPRLGATRI